MQLRTPPQHSADSPDVVTSTSMDVRIMVEMPVHIELHNVNRSMEKIYHYDD